MLFRQGKGRLALNVRLSRSMPPPLEQLGLPQQVLPVLRGAQRGLVLLTGPMSSGKTSTAQAMLHHRNTMRPGHIVTIEDPIETDLQPSKCLITTKEVGTDVPSFHAGLLDALRQACDVLFIGELRDADTIRTAITAAASGILVVATTHGDTCTGTLSKMMTLLGAEAAGYYKLLAQNLVCVIRQAMVPSTDGSSWHVVADALLPKPQAGQVAGLLEQGDIAKLEGQLAGATPQQRSEEWVSMNDQLSTLVKEGKVQLAVARQVSTLPKGLGG
jgi:twitching motility protein PilT